MHTHNGLFLILIFSFVITCIPASGSCASNPCLNYGTCTNVKGTSDYQCKCAEGYTGKRCGKVINHCASVSCLNSATCVNSLHTYTCKCAEKFYGPYCEYDDVPDTTALATLMGCSLVCLAIAIAIIWRLTHRLQKISENGYESESLNGDTESPNYQDKPGLFDSHAGDSSKFEHDPFKLDHESSRLENMLSRNHGVSTIDASMIGVLSTYEDGSFKEYRVPTDGVASVKPTRIDTSSMFEVASSMPSVSSKIDQSLTYNTYYKSAETCKDNDCTSYATDDGMYYFRLFQFDAESTMADVKSVSDYSPVIAKRKIKI
ncbi:uncharacterized protein LOC121387858 [Gigantopelta aegis]|uniref:uncharacterized protein LOC121387858 n=1 Tax=Gigantopelta aegis TaxID=1735272 RepID=UPI001B88DE8B|nr:uncharacterized protein LOC121387858 [Gigantopelta aegis]